MLNDAACFKQIYIVCGFTDLRSGIDTLVSVIEQKTNASPYIPDTLYLFCGRRTDRIKGIVWENDGFLLLYKRLEQGKFVWPRNESEVKALPAILTCRERIFMPYTGPKESYVTFEVFETGSLKMPYTAFYP